MVIRGKKENVKSDFRERQRRIQRSIDQSTALQPLRMLQTKVLYKAISKHM